PLEPTPSGRTTRSLLRPSGEVSPEKYFGVASLEARARGEPSQAKASSKPRCLPWNGIWQDLLTRPGATKRKAQERVLSSRLIPRQLPTLPRGLPRSTIGAEGLNCRVRNGNGCGPLARITGKTSYSFPKSREVGETESSSRTPYALR